MGFEADITRIVMRLCYGQTQEEIHDDLCCVADLPQPGMMSEETFFFAWHAAQMLVGKSPSNAAQPVVD